MDVSRRKFLSWIVATTAGCGVVAGKEEPQYEFVALATKRCPKCGDWMQLPEKTTRKPNKHYQPVTITCKCRICDYEETSDVLCMVHPLLAKS